MYLLLIDGYDGSFVSPIFTERAAAKRAFTVANRHARLNQAGRSRNGSVTLGEITVFADEIEHVTLYVRIKETA